MRKIVLISAVALFLLVPLVAWAVPDLLDDPQAFLATFLEAISNSNWKVVGGIAIMGLVGLFRAYGPERLKSGKAAFLTSVAIGALVGLSGGLLGSEPLGGIVGILGLMLQGVTTALVGSGLYSGGKKLLEKKPPTTEE